MSFTKTIFLLIVLINLLVTSSYAQPSKVQIYRGDILKSKEEKIFVETRSIVIKVISVKTREALRSYSITIDAMDVQIKDNAQGIISFEIPYDPNQRSIEIEIHKNRYFSKKFELFLGDKMTIKKTYALRYNKYSSCFYTTICPTF